MLLLFVTLGLSSEVVPPEMLHFDRLIKDSSSRNSNLILNIYNLQNLMSLLRLEEILSSFDGSNENASSSSQSD